MIDICKMFGIVTAKDIKEASLAVDKLDEHVHEKVNGEETMFRIQTIREKTASKGRNGINALKNMCNPAPRPRKKQ